MDIQIKVVGHEDNKVYIKYASENSAKPIDEYDAVAYELVNVATLDAYIEQIRAQVIANCTLRDNQEHLTDTPNIASWVGETATITHSGQATNMGDYDTNGRLIYNNNEVLL